VRRLVACSHSAYSFCSPNDHDTAFLSTDTEDRGKYLTFVRNYFTPTHSGTAFTHTSPCTKARLSVSMLRNLSVLQTEGKQKQNFVRKARMFSYKTLNHYKPRYGNTSATLLEKRPGIFQRSICQVSCC
jgi:hypothetical protein